MTVSRDVARANFSVFVKRALREARSQGLTDDKIVRLTGVGDSTFHKWAKGDGGLPKLAKVQAFCAGLDIPLKRALAALGMDDAREPTPESPLDPDIKRLAKAFADPNVAEVDKQAALRA